jgi:hypothetical protein
VESIRTLLPLLIPILVIQLALQIAALVDLVRRQKTARAPKWLWALVIILFNLLGPLVYFLLGREE